MNRPTLLPAILFGTLVLAPLASAFSADFWVGPRGNDKGRGLMHSPWASLQYAADHVKPGDTVHVLDGDYIGFHLGRGGNPAARITFLAEGDNVRIVKPNAKTSDGINLEGAPYITLDGFIVNNMPRAGIRATHANETRIRRVRVDNNAVWGIFLSFCDDAMIEYNITTRARSEHGIYVSNSGDRPVIRGNVVYGNRACGIHMNGDATAGGDGIITGAVVDSNTIFANGAAGGSSINADGVQNSKFTNNVIYDTPSRGIALFRDNGGGPSKDNVVAHNTIVMGPNARWGLMLKNGATGVHVFNNIILHDKTARGDVLVSEDSRPGFLCDNNLYTGRFAADSDEKGISFTRWKDAVKGDAHSALATPEALFVESLKGDFHLRPGCAAIDAADSKYSPRLDRDAQPRGNGSRPDLGAYEFKTPDAPKPSPSPTP